MPFFQSKNSTFGEIESHICWYSPLSRPFGQAYNIHQPPCRLRESVVTVVMPKSTTFCSSFSSRKNGHNSTMYVVHMGFSSRLYYLPSSTFETKLTIALAGCSGSSSANNKHWLPPFFFATNPNILQRRKKILLSLWQHLLWNKIKFDPPLTSFGVIRPMATSHINITYINATQAFW